MLTPVQSRILKVLDDGEPHSREELQKCLNDDLAPDTAVKWHINSLRVILAKRGRGILCDKRSGQAYYRQVMFISSGD